MTLFTTIAVNLRPIFLACGTVLTPIFFVACQTLDPVVYECQELLETINNVVTEAQTITEAEQSLDGDEPNLDVWLQAADTLKQGSEAIADLEIKNPLLSTYQTKISEVYSEQAEATYTMVDAWQKKNLDTAFAAQNRTKAAGEVEKITGESLNTYCQNKKEEAQAET